MFFMQTLQLDKQLLLHISVILLFNEYPAFLDFHEGGVYEINLDRRKLKTPGGKLFAVPNEALAIAVATEWDAQRDTLKFYTMHMVRLCDWI